jgi:SAM-dependent methyltransferase
MEYTTTFKQRFINNCKIVGVLPTIKQLLLFALGDFCIKHSFPGDRFDAKYGVSTYEEVEPSEAGITDSIALKHAVVYAPTHEGVMRAILRHAVNGLDPREFTYIDLGCGKGRTLLMAAQYPFKEVLGVEVSPLLCEIASQNIKKYLTADKGARCKNIRVSCENALNFRFPETNLLVYMFNPFSGYIVHGVVHNLQRFHAVTGRKVLVAYARPVEDQILQNSGAFVKRMEYQTIHPNETWSLWECRAKTA